LKNKKMKERKNVAGDFSIFICAAEKRVANGTTPAHGTKDDKFYKKRKSCRKCIRF